VKKPTPKPLILYLFFHQNPQIFENFQKPGTRGCFHSKSIIEPESKVLEIMDFPKSQN
jgi:hypothetical protein